MWSSEDGEENNALTMGETIEANYNGKKRIAVVLSAELIVTVDKNGSSKSFIAHQQHWSAQE